MNFSCNHHFLPKPSRSSIYRCPYVQKHVVFMVHVFRGACSEIFVLLLVTELATVELEFSFTVGFCQQISDTNRVSYNSIQFWPDLLCVGIKPSEMKAQFPTGCSCFRLKTGSSGCLHVYLVGCKFGASSNPRVDNSLEQLTQLKKLLYWQGSFCYKGYKSAARWRVHRARWKKVQSPGAMLCYSPGILHHPSSQEALLRANIKTELKI